MKITPMPLAGLDLLMTAVIALGESGEIVYLNGAAESLLDSSLKSLHGERLAALFLNESEMVEVFSVAAYALSGARIVKWTPKMRQEFKLSS